MNYERLKEKGLVEETPPNFKQVASLLSRALKDLRTAKANLESDEEWAYAIAYQAIIRAARALILAEGYRPKGREAQKTIILLVGALRPADFGSLINKLDIMRRKRQSFIEETGRPISKYEVADALQEAEEFVSRVLKMAKEKNPQLSFI
ncbi:MAG: HEPN domain-containing protein [candidate division NC10 bacterium]|nr:HEPN domain-containing protein [candidate division NC10 bacterium]